MFKHRTLHKTKAPKESGPPSETRSGIHLHDARRVRSSRDRRHRGAHQTPRHRGVKGRAFNASQRSQEAALRALWQAGTAPATAFPSRLLSEGAVCGCQSRSLRKELQVFSAAPSFMGARRRRSSEGCPQKKEGHRGKGLKRGTRRRNMSGSSVTNALSSNAGSCTVVSETSTHVRQWLTGVKANIYLSIYIYINIYACQFYK